MPGLKNISLVVLLLPLLSILPPVIFAHGEELKITDTDKGPIRLTAEQKKMIGLKLVSVTERPMSEHLSLNGQIQLIPNAQADVSIRISGSITAIEANLGDQVKQGQQLAIVQSRLVGNPPPSVAVTAPIAGVIDARNVNLGQAVEPNTIIFHISDRRHLLVVAQVYEEDIGKVRLGQQVNIYPLSYPHKVFTGQISLIEPNLDPMTRTVNVQISLANPENLLKPGMFVNAQVILADYQAALVVPNAAVLENDGQAFVFVEKQGHYLRQVIHTGVSDEQVTVVKEGLKKDDRVVTQGVRELYTLWLTGMSPAPRKEKE